MTALIRCARGTGHAARALLRDRRGAEAVELAIVIFPFLYILLVILQMGLVYMTQAALDNAVNAEANNLRNSFNTGTAPVVPAAGTIKTAVFNYSGAALFNKSSLAVDLRALANLDAAPVPVTDGTTDSVSTSVPLVLRATASVYTVAPGFGAFTVVQSVSILRFDAF